MSGPYGPPAGAPPGQQSGPPPGWNPGPPRAALGLDKILALSVAGLGVVLLLLGLLDAFSATRSISFALAFGWATALYLAAGLLALGALLPKAGVSSFAVAAVSLSATLVLLFAFFGATGAGPGFIVSLIVGIVQTVAATVGYLFGAGLIKMTPEPAYNPYGAGYPGQGYGPQQGQPQQGLPQQGQPQQGQPQYGPPQQGPPLGYGPPTGPMSQGPPGYGPPTSGQPGGYPGSSQ